MKEYFIIQKDKFILKKRGAYTDLINKKGVYYFFNDKDDLLYIGSSKNLYVRFVSHISNGGMFSFFEWNTFLAIYCDNYKELEKIELRQHHTYLNGKGFTSKIYK